MWKNEGTNVGRLNSVTVPGDAKHSVAGSLGDEGVRAFFARFEGNDVLDSPVTTESTSDTCVRTIFS